MAVKREAVRGEAERVRGKEVGVRGEAERVRGQV